MRRNILVCAATAATVLLGACSSDNAQPVTIWTSETSVADYVHWYNAHVDGPPVEVEPIERGSGYEKLREGRTHPDIVIDRHLLKADAADRYAGVQGVVAGRRGEFYAPLLRAGVREDTQRLIPLSFDVPAVMFSSAYEPAQDRRRSIELEELAVAAIAFNERDDDRFIRMGYSPLWQPEFVRTVIESFGARFRSGPDLLPLWSHESVEQAVEFMRTWSEEGNESVALQDDFQSRYLVAPGNRGVQEERAGFWYTTASRFYTLPDSETTGLDVRWITRDNRLAVADRVLWAGISANAGNVSGAREFLRWLTDPETQAHLVRRSYSGMSVSFGFAGGFSAIRRVNHRALVEAAPDMTGRTPVEEQLQRPVVEHVLWPRVREETIVPWAIEAVRGEADDTLRARLDNWIRRQEL